MCLKLLVSFECFCDSRIVESFTHTYCVCENIKFDRLIFGFCDVCVINYVRNRQKLKKILLSFQREEFSEVYYHNSVKCFVQREIKF